MSNIAVEPYLYPPQNNDESEISSAPSTPGPSNEDEVDDFPFQKIESPLSSREGSQQPAPSDERPKQPIDTIPPEILIQILAKLSSPQDLLNSLRVSRGWARCCVDLLWHRPLFTSWNRLEVIAKSIQKEDPYWRYQDLIRRLNLSNLSQDVNDGTLQPFTGCNRVERLTLTGCDKLTDHGVTSLIQGNNNLLALDVTHVTALTDMSIDALSENCTRLQGLNITGCRNITDDSLVPLAEACKYLKRVCSIASLTFRRFANSGS